MHDKVQLDAYRQQITRDDLRMHIRVMRDGTQYVRRLGKLTVDDLGRVPSTADDIETRVDAGIAEFGKILENLGYASDQTVAEILYPDEQEGR